MVISDALLAAFSFVGVVNSIFLATYLFFRKHDKKISNIFMAFLLLAIAVRISKSLIYYILKTDTNYAIITMGHSAMTCIGPLTYLYFQSVFKKEFKLRWIHSLHFVFSMLVLSLNTWLIKINFSYLVRHKLILLQFAIYITISAALVLKSFRLCDRTQRQYNSIRFVWFAILLILVFLVWFGYLLHHVLNVMIVIVPPALYSLCLFLMLYLFINRPGFSLTGDLFMFKKVPMPAAESNEIFNKILSIYHEDKLFLDPDLSLTKLAKFMGIKSYKVSKAINIESGQTFIQFTNRHRIKNAMGMLNNKDYDDQTILSVAYDSGFNSFSAFSSAFKKTTGLTPSQYKKN